MPGLGLQGAYGAAGGEDALKQMIVERLKAEAVKQQLAQQGIENQQRDRQLGQGDRRLAQDQEQIDLAKTPKPQGPMTLSPGASVFDPTSGRIVTTAPTTPPPPRGPMALSPGSRLIDPATGRLIASAPTTPPAPKDERLVQVQGPNGNPIWVRESDAVGKPAANAPRAPTGADRTALGFFNRMVEAERNARSVEDKLGGKDLAAQQYAPGWLENWLQSKEGQAYTQAQRMYTEARLRKESGAAIPQSEFDTDRKTNFRIAGDTGDLITQKRHSRLTTMRGLGNASGRAFQEYYGEGMTLDDVLKEFADQQATPAGPAPKIRAIRQVK